MKWSNSVQLQFLVLGLSYVFANHFDEYSVERAGQGGEGTRSTSVTLHGWVAEREGQGPGSTADETSGDCKKAGVLSTEQDC